jgi:hypothetical protein
LKTVLDQDPFTGLTEWFNYDPVADEVTVYSEQKEADLKRFLDHTERVRNDPEISRQGIKNSFWRYAQIPPIVQVERRNKGIDIFNPSHTKALLKAINEQYPYTKTTDKMHR